MNDETTFGPDAEDPKPEATPTPDESPSEAPESDPATTEDAGQPDQAEDPRIAAGDPNGVIGPAPIIVDDLGDSDGGSADGEPGPAPEPKVESVDPRDGWAYICKTHDRPLTASTSDCGAGDPAACVKVANH